MTNETNVTQLLLVLFTYCYYCHEFHPSPAGLHSKTVPIDLIDSTFRSPSVVHYAVQIQVDLMGSPIAIESCGEDQGGANMSLVGRILTSIPDPQSFRHHHLLQSPVKLG